MRELRLTAPCGDGGAALQLMGRASGMAGWRCKADVENAAASHPTVAEAAVIGVAHPKWQERPLLLVVPRAGHQQKTR